MFLLAISDTNVGLSLFIVEREYKKCVEIFQKYFVVTKSQRIEICTFVPRNPAFAKFHSR